MRRDILSKKALGPVVATSLLLVVAVVAIIGFQSWFAGYSSTLSIDTEKKGGELKKELGVETIVGSTLYIKNTVYDNLSIRKIKLGDKDCNISLNLSFGINNISIAQCLENLSSNMQRITIVTDERVAEKEMYLGDIEVSISEEGGVSLASLSCSTDSDGDGYISYTCASYPMSETAFEGHLDADDGSSTVTADPNCWLKTDSSCESNFVVDGCGSGTVQDIGTGLCWQRNMSTAGQMAWSDAKIYCDSLSLGGSSDWRLPTRQELFSIRDPSRSGPAIVGGDNNKFINVASSYYQSASTYGPSTIYVWLVDFYGGYAAVAAKSNDGSYVLCVR